MKDSLKTFLNILIVLITPLPSVWAGWYLNNVKCDPETMCSYTQDNALVSINILLLINFDLGFTILNWMQGSMWLLDLYWSLLPQLQAHYYQTRFNAFTNPTRAYISLALVWIWAIRLTHNYLRREEYKIGHAEDWRLNDLRKQFGKWWFPASFFVAYFSQHLMLFGLAVPFYGVFNSKEPINYFDGIAIVLCLSGILFSFIADNQLRAYMVENAQREKENKLLILKTGLWKYSRHPNHFGEQLWWVGLSFFALASNHNYLFLGFLFNHICEYAATLPLIEKRMMKNPARVEAWKQYCKVTPLIIPYKVCCMGAENENEDEKKFNQIASGNNEVL